MTTMLMPLLLLSASNLEDPHQRFERFAKVYETLSVDLEIRDISAKEKGFAKVRISQPNKVHFGLKWANIDYSFTMVDKKGVEFDRTDQSYFEYVGAKGLYYPSSGFYPGQQFFPLLFASRNLKKSLDGGDQLKPAGKKTFEGQTGDLLTASIPTEGGAVALQVLIGSDGRPLVISTKGGGVDRTTIFKNYKINERIPKSEFSLDIPAGLSPLTTAGTDREVIQVGAQTKLGTWIDASSGKAVDLQKAISGKKTLLAFLGDDAPSAESIPALKELREVPVVVLTEGKSDNGLKKHGFPTYIDNSGKGADALRPEGTPHLFLVDAGGKVIGSWFGYAPEDKAKLLKDIRAILAGRSEE